MKKKSKRSLGVPLLLTAAIVIVLGLAWGFYLILPSQSAGIFEISALPEGGVEVTGTLSKDTALGETGSYYVMTEEGDVIALDSVDLDLYVGETVVVRGLLNYAETGSPYMLTSSVTKAE